MVSTRANNIIFELPWHIGDHCYIWIRPDPDVPRGGRKVESGGQLSTVLTRTRAGETRSRPEETKTAGAEPEILSVPKNLRERRERSK